MANIYEKQTLYCSLTDTINAIYSQVIFVQYAYSLLAIVANVFEASFVSFIFELYRQFKFLVLFNMG